jgi:hypothetical protein
MNRHFALLAAVSCLLVSGIAFGQAAPMKSVGVQVTKMSGVEQDNCFDVQDLYVKVTLPDGQVLTADPHVAGIDGNGSTCGGWAAPYLVDVSSQSVVFTTDLLACEDDALFHAEVFEKDGGLNHEDDLIMACDLDVLSSSGEFCCEDGNLNKAVCLLPVVNALPDLDADGDGLSNLEETYGRDVNCDGTMT